VVKKLKHKNMKKEFFAILISWIAAGVAIGVSEKHLIISIILSLAVPPAALVVLVKGNPIKQGVFTILCGLGIVVGLIGSIANYLSEQ